MKNLAPVSDDNDVPTLASSKPLGLPNAGNSSSANLTNGATFTGTGVDVEAYLAITVSVYVSHASATDGLSLQFSEDNSTWRVADTYTIPAASLRTFTLRPQLKYFRLVYTNGGTGTTSLTIKTSLYNGALNASSQRPSDTLLNDNDFEMAMASVMGYDETNNVWKRIRVSTTGEQKVLQYREGARLSATSAGLTTATTAYTAGDQMGNLITFASASRANGGTGLVTGATIISAADQVGPIDIVLFRASVTLAADNAAFAISDADALNVVHLIQCYGVFDIGNNRIVQASNLAIPYDTGAGTSLYAGLITRAGHTFFGATTDLQINLYVERN